MKARINNMKKYTTSEILKSLAEKTNLKFILVNGSKNLGYMGAIASNYMGYFMVENINGINIDLQFMSGISLNGVWELAQEPVTFMEAMNSKKRIRYKDLQNYYSSESILRDFAGYTAERVLEKINGEWFIEDGETN